MRRWFSLRMARRHLRAGARRMVLSVVAIGLGVALIVAVQLMNRAVLESFLATVDAMLGRAALFVDAGEHFDFSEDVVSRVAAVPGVALAVPVVSGIVFADDGSGTTLTVHGVDLTHDAAVRVYHVRDQAEDIVDDLVSFLNQPDSILLGRTFADQRGLAIGSTLHLVTPHGVQRFTVRGLLEPQGLAKTLRGRLVVMDLFAAQRAFTGDRRINRVDLLVDDGVRPDVVKARVDAILPPGLRVEEPAARKGIVQQTVAAFQVMLSAFGLLAVVAGFVICYSRFNAMFEARTWEAGLLRAVGLRQSVVLTELLKESLLLAVTGVALGLPVGIGIARLGLPFVAAATAINFDMPIPEVASAYPADALILGVVVGVVAAAAAAILPARRLARTSPTQALSIRGREPSSRGGPRWALPTALLVGIGVTVAAQAVSGSVALGHLTTGLIALATCTLAAPLVGAGSRSLPIIWQHAFGPLGRLAAGQLQRHPRRTALMVAALAVGIGTVLMFGTLGWSFEQTLLDRLTGRMRADLQISSAHLGGAYRYAPMEDTVVDELRRIPGITAVAGNQQVEIATPRGPLVLDSFDPECFLDRRLCDRSLGPGALPNTPELVARGEAVLVSTVFARRYGTGPGDVVHVPSPGGVVALKVAAVTGGQTMTAIVMSRPAYRGTWQDDRIRYAHAVLESGADGKTVEAAIARALGRKYRLYVRSSTELVDYWVSQVRRAFGLLYVMEVITFLLVVVGMGDLLAADVLERTRELAMMRAVGLHRSHLFAMVVLESAAVGLLGLLLAVGSGLALAVIWVEMQFPALAGWDLDLHLPYRFAVTAAALTMTLCLAGSFLPSVRAARLTISRALHDE